MSRKKNLIENCRYKEMWEFSNKALVAGGMKRRDLSDYFENYNLKLPIIFRFVFGCSRIGIRLMSYESKSAAVASLSQMERPAGSSYYGDLAFFVRPSAALRAPVLHGDAMDPTGGVKGMFAMDMFNCNREDVDVDEFLGDDIEAVEKALEIVKPYQKTPAQGRGKYTAYMDPYKSPYRIELAQPPANDIESLRKFYDDELESYKLYFGAYLSSLSKLQPEDAVVDNNKNGFDEFIEKIQKNDFAAKSGKKMLRDDFYKYFNEGCWRVGHYGEGI